MSPWILLAFDVIVACLAVGGVTLIVRSLATRHLSFAARVAQGRVQEDTTPEITRWLRRMGASALDSLGSTSESVARRLILAGAAPEVSCSACVKPPPQSPDSSALASSSQPARPLRCARRSSRLSSVPSSAPYSASQAWTATSR